MIDIVIPTRGRVGQQTTLQSLRKLKWPLDRVFLVCPRDEVNHHKLRSKDNPVVGQPDLVTTIEAKRSWIIQTWGTISPNHNILMLDDDLEFQGRDPQGRYINSEATPERFARAMLAAEDLMNTNRPSALYHGGFASRLFSTGWTGAVERTKRQMHALFYNTSVCSRTLAFGRVLLREDFDYNLQLLRQGYDNFLITDLVVSPKSYGAPGGCADERTVELSNAQCDVLAALHPGLVKVKQKMYKATPRKEVVVSWKKALGFDK